MIINKFCKNCRSFEKQQFQISTEYYCANKVVLKKVMQQQKEFLILGEEVKVGKIKCEDARRWTHLCGTKATYYDERYPK